jgi:group I intron endonuclease
MYSGIYCLYWPIPNLRYIGKSEYLPRRKREHIKAMENLTHFNYRVQEAYNSYGIPEFIILELCEISLLLPREEYWASTFDSILNISKPGTTGGSGLQHPNSKYSKLDILKVFRLLYNSTNYSSLHISKVSGLPISMINNISNQNRHMWIQEKYPKLYIRMKELNITRNNTLKSNGVLPKIVSPEGIEIEISNIKQFCLSTTGVTESGIQRVLRGELVYHHGWHLPGAPTRKLKSVVSPEGIIYNIDNLSQFCLSNLDKLNTSFNAARCGFNRLFSGKCTTYKGWRINE